MQVENSNTLQIISDEKELWKHFQKMSQSIQKMENFDDPGISNEKLIEQFVRLQKSIASLGLFSQNQKFKEFQTEHLKYLVLPYYIGFVFGRISNPRKEAVFQSKAYLTSYLKMIQNFNSEDQQIFPKNALKTWENLTTVQNYKFNRDQVIQNAKEKKMIQNRFENSEKIKQDSDQRQSIKDYITLQVYEAIGQLKTIEEELMILKYKESIEKDPESKEKHEQEMSKPTPKIKVWQIKKPEQIQNLMIPEGNFKANLKKQKIAKVWQENANKPTITNDQVADMEYERMVQNGEKAKQAEKYKEDSDSENEGVDQRKKYKARAWDNWKDDNEKGAGNRNGK